MNPLVVPVVAGFSLYAFADRLRQNHVAPAAILDKASVALSASQRRDQAAQLCAV
jgi:hypothetical protein